MDHDSQTHIAFPNHCTDSWQSKWVRLAEEEDVRDDVLLHRKGRETLMTLYHSGAAPVLQPRLAHPATRCFPK